MISKIALTLFLGQPLFMFWGMLAFFFLLFTATVGALNFKGITKIPFKWHPRLAITTIIFALIHVFMVLSIRFNF